MVPPHESREGKTRGKADPILARPRLILVTRVALLLLIAGAAVWAFSIAGSDRAVGRYVCPMHPEVSSNTAGECPICGMALRKVGVVAAGSKPGEPSSGVIQAPGHSLSPPSQPIVMRNYDVGPVVSRVFSRRVQVPASFDSPETVSALLFRDDIDGLAPDELGSFAPALAPERTITVRRRSDPPRPWDNETRLVRFDVESDPSGLTPGDVGWIAFPKKARPALVVPYTAILQSSHGPYVLVVDGDDRGFARRPVEIGRIINGLAVVLAGLRAGERVALGNAFLLDADVRLRARSTEAAP